MFFGGLLRTKLKICQQSVVIRDSSHDLCFRKYLWRLASIVPSSQCTNPLFGKWPKDVARWKLPEPKCNLADFVRVSSVRAFSSTKHSGQLWNTSLAHYWKSNQVFFRLFLVCALALLLAATNTFAKTWIGIRTPGQCLLWACLKPSWRLSYSQTHENEGDEIVHFHSS